MNCIIVDDDLFSTRLIADFIRRTSTVSLLSTFTNAIDAIDYISVSKEKIEIIFLDIEMPEMSGMDFIKLVDIRNTQVIIYSSQEKYALESYEYNVCDYLLKPVTYARFIKSINKAKAELAKLEQGTEIKPKDDDDKPAEVEDVYLRDNMSTVYKVRFCDIIYVEAQENYVDIATTTRKITVHRTMKEILEMIPEKFITRAHRSYAIGNRFLKDIIGNELVLLLADKNIPIGKSYKDNIKELISNANS